MNDAIKQIEKELDGITYRLSIYQDDTSGDGPREWDNVGTMVCWHRRYNLGDEQPKDSPTCWLNDFAEFYDDEEKYSGEEADKIIWKKLNKKYIFLPLYLYDHSGITISTGAFSCPWDSGQVGWIYVEKKKAMKECSTKLRKRWTKAFEKKIIEHLEAEVKTYNQYLTGDVYGFVIERKETCSLGHVHWEKEDSCWGFYGHDFKESGMVDYWGEKFTKLFKEVL